MTFTKFLPVAITVGILAAFSVILWSFWLPTNMPIWAIFISWGLYFIAGAKPSRLHKEVIGLTGGIIFGYLTLWALPYSSQVFSASYGLPAVVFVVATIIVLLELTDWFELAPAYFLSYAGYFAYVFGSFNGAGTTTAGNSIVPFWAVTMIGLAFGYVSAYLRVKILDWQGVTGTAQQTVFDKEKP